ncbi:DUF2510 domain-containing protein [Streptomyces sp. NPDC006622]|uniref:DUF2510 domain-containing protein n=1 Tax=Streptomyces sp. NPDC006622 TaxID=3155459 RepID=UPI0033AF04E5
MTPPPGWYGDPTAPHQERWWDGTTWTDHRRAPWAPAGPAGEGFGPPTPVSPPTPPVTPLAEGFGPPAGPVPQGFAVPAGTGRRPSSGGGGRSRPVAPVVVAAALVAAVVTGVVVLRGDGDGTEPAAAPPAGTSSAPATTPDASTPAPPPDPSATPSAAPSVVVDELNGITLPLPEGWVLPEHVAEPDVVMTTDGTYDCPGGGVCRHGRVVSRTVTDTAETSPRALAEADIADAADDAYDRDLVGRRPFGGIESHKAVAAGQVAVGGRAGYYVRWRVTTAEGPGGYVQSLVFPSTVGTEAPVLVRYVFDAGEDGPPLTDMDRITKGIRPAGDADTGGGVGSGLTPKR